MFDDLKPERIVAGMAFTEGPLWMGSHLLFSDIPNNRIVKWQVGSGGPEVTTWRFPSGDAEDRHSLRLRGSNGLTLDRQGRLLACEHGNRRVSRTDSDGTVVTLADRYRGKRLNSPNDVVCRSDGMVYFSDPPYGLVNQEEEREQDANGFYRVAPDGEVVRVVDDFDRPNGLAFSPDEKLLYLADTRRLHVRVFDVTPEGDLVNGRLFAELPNPHNHGPDGMKVDGAGNLYVAGAGGVWVFAPDGARLAVIETPERPANLAWGGEGWRTLFVTAQSCVYRIEMPTEGIPVR